MLPHFLTFCDTLLNRLFSPHQKNVFLVWLIRGVLIFPLKILPFVCMGFWVLYFLDLSHPSESQSESWSVDSLIFFLKAHTLLEISFYFYQWYRCCVLDGIPARPPKMERKDMLRKLIQYEQMENSQSDSLVEKRRDLAGWFLRRRSGTKTVTSSSRKIWTFSLFDNLLNFFSLPIDTALEVSLRHVHVGEIYRDNAKEWLAYAFFHQTLEETTHLEDQHLLEEMVIFLEKSVDVVFRSGYNHNLKPMRITMDRIRYEPRPLVFYAVTQGVLQWAGEIGLRNLGFVKEKSGTMVYWRRSEGPQRGPDSETSESSGRTTKVSQPPLVFIHGIGVGLLPYLPFLETLMKENPGRGIFLPTLPHLSLRLEESVMSAGETAGAISDMLHAHYEGSSSSDSEGTIKAHFIGHSFGTIVLSWLVRQQPKLISHLSFLDPVCFQLVKPDVAYNFVYRGEAHSMPKPTHVLLNFFVAKELHTAHALQKGFFWHQNLLTTEELKKSGVVGPGPESSSRTSVFVQLSELDSIIPSSSVRRYLEEKLGTVQILWHANVGHGEWTTNPCEMHRLPGIVQGIQDCERGLRYDNGYVKKQS